MPSGPGNCDNENESTSVSVRQSGRPLVPTDNPLSVGLVSNNTTTMTRDLSLLYGFNRFRAATNDYFHHRLIILSVKCEKNAHHNFPEPKVTSLKLFKIANY